MEVEKLLPKQFLAVSLLSCGESITSVAEQLTVSRKTVSGWVNGNADFQEALRSCQEEMFAEAILRVRGLMTRGLDVISDGLENPNYRIRFSAAVKIWSLNSAALVQYSRPPEVEAPAKLSAKDEETKINEILSAITDN
jgi:predicted transcriptional regulator